MTTPEMKQDKAASETRFPAEYMKQTGTDHDLGWFAVAPGKKEITEAIKKDIKAFLDFVQTQKKTRS